MQWFMLQVTRQHQSKKHKHQNYWSMEPLISFTPTCMWQAVALRLKKCACDQMTADVELWIDPEQLTGAICWPIWTGTEPGHSCDTATVHPSSLSWIYPPDWNLCQNRHFCISYLASVAVVHWQNRCCSYIWKKKLKLAEQVQLQFHKPHVCNLNLHAMSTEPQWAHSFSKCTAEHPLCSHICLS